MNEPLKHKLFTIYGALLNPKILKEAWKHVKRNKGCAGIDKISIQDFEEHLEEYIQDILEELKSKTYKPSPVARKYIPKKNGKRRPLGIPTIKDRIIQQAVVMRIQPFMEENVFHDNSCGFRPNRDVELALKKLICRLDSGYIYIYDFDIKGYFDNIPHKKLMKVLNKYISDGTVLDMIWKWLKAGYMEDSIRYESKSGVQQGGVISPILANIYLNELDWELAKAGHEFVRYADDAVILCKSLEEYERAKALVQEVLAKLGLELAEDKTKDVDFRNDDFDFLGFTFEHLRTSKKGHEYYILSVRDKSIKEFKQMVKTIVKKSYTYSYEKWREILNPKIRGKYNYYLRAVRARKSVQEEWQKRGRKTKCIVNTRVYKILDGYIRQRLRMSLANRGKRHARYADGKILKVKYDNEFFLKVMRIVSGQYLHWQTYDENITMEEFLRKSKIKNKYDKKNDEFFKYALAR